MRLDFFDLQLFLNIVDSGSLTKGAERSSISLQAASERIKKLEQQYTVSLFTRHASGVKLTIAGQTFAEQASLLIQQRKQLEQIKSGTQLTTEALQKTGLDKVLDNWIENTALGKNLKVGVVDYLSMGGEIYYDHKLQQYNGISKNEFIFRFVTKAASGLTSAHFGSLAGAAVGAEYGATVGGLVGTVVGAGIGFYIENTYWRGIKYFDNFMQRMDGYIQRQVIFNARRGF